MDRSFSLGQYLSESISSQQTLKMQQRENQMLQPHKKKIIQLQNQIEQLKKKIENNKDQLLAFHIERLNQLKQTISLSKRMTQMTIQSERLKNENKKLRQDLTIQCKKSEQAQNNQNRQMISLKQSYKRLQEQIQALKQSNYYLQAQIKQKEQQKIASENQPKKKHQQNQTESQRNLFFSLEESKSRLEITQLKKEKQQQSQRIRSLQNELETYRFEQKNEEVVGLKHELKRLIAKIAEIQEKSKDQQIKNEHSKRNL